MEGATLFMSVKLVTAAAVAFVFIGAALALGRLFSECASALGRNPEARPAVFPVMIIGFAAIEFLALLAFVVVMIILFVINV
jgi:F-type H+-transporting ATPase subunit c